MVSVKALTYASIVVSALMLITALYTGDYYWVVPVAINIFLMSAPIRRGGDGNYPKQILLSSIVPLLFQIPISLLYYSTSFLHGIILLDVVIYCYVSAFLMSASTFTSGLMFISGLDRSGVGVCLTKRWIILLAMVFSLSISVGSLFFQFIYLYTQGYPVFNLQVVSPVDRISNNIMMVSPFVTTFSSALFAIITIRLLRGKDKGVFFEERVL